MHPSDTGTKTLDTHQPCIRCSYDLHGLPLSGNCPECGVPVERSLRGDLLQFADENYRATLLRGVSLIMFGILAHVVLFILGMVAGFAGGAGVGFALSIISLAATATGLYGYFLYASPDPGQMSNNRGEKPRQILRVAIGVSAIAAIGQIALGGLALFMAPTPGQVGAAEGVLMLSAVAGLAGSVAWIVQFFAAMLYTKWLAPRIPSPRVLKRASLLMWLGPVLFLLFCTVVAPLIALIMYYNMFSWIRQALITIRDEGEYFDDPTKILN
jgi:hypothetical protein